MTVIGGIIILGILIIIHEFGHFLAAKLVRIKVYEFAVGFGPKIVSKSIGDTVFSIRSIPLGGYVSLAGLDDQGDSNIDPSLSFNNKSYLQKIFVILMGPFANFLSAVFFVWASLYFYGLEVPSNLPIVGDVVSFSPAYKAGFKSGDHILAVNDKEVSTFSEIADIVMSSSGQAKFKIKRGEEILEIFVEPVLESEAEAFLRNQQPTRRLIGIMTSFDFEELSFVQSMQLAVLKTYTTTLIILRVLKGLIQGQVSKKELAGPLTIVSEAGTNIKKGGRAILLFMFLLSVNLALINLLPFPLLDGGHIVILTFEKIINRPVPDLAKTVLNYFGLAFLIILTVLVLKNDIKRLLFS